jgi:hypothetical protein
MYACLPVNWDKYTGFTNNSTDSLFIPTWADGINNKFLQGANSVSATKSDFATGTGALQNANCSRYKTAAVGESND